MMPATMPKWSISSTLMSNTEFVIPQKYTVSALVPAECGLQPDMGHEVLWVIWDCLSGEILLAQTLLSAATEDLAALLKQVKQALSVPVAGVIAHGLCHFHYLSEADMLIYEADRHAKKELKMHSARSAGS